MSKVKLVKMEPVFTPIKVEITIENQVELEDFIYLSQSDTIASAMKSDLTHNLSAVCIDKWLEIENKAYVDRYKALLEYIRSDEDSGVEVDELLDRIDKLGGE